MSLPDTAETAARPSTKGSVMNDLPKWIGIALALAGALIGYGVNKGAMSEKVVTDDATHAVYEKRLTAVEQDQSNIKADLAVLKDRSGQALDAQKRVEEKLDRIISQH